MGDEKVTGLPLEDRVARVLQMKLTWMDQYMASEALQVAYAILNDELYIVSTQSSFCRYTLTDRDLYQTVLPWLVLPQVTRKRLENNHKLSSVTIPI